MKQYISAFLMILTIGSTFAIDTSCFEQVSTINNPGSLPANLESQTIKFSTYSSNIYPYQDNKLLNTKIYQAQTIDYIDYDIVGLSSNSQKSSIIKSGGGFEFDQYDKLKQIIIKPVKALKKGTFDINISYDGGNIKYQISKDSMSRSDISENISNYDIDDSFNVLFKNYDKNSLQNTTIYKISITQKGKSELAINSNSDNPINIYSNYNCKDEELQKEVNNLVKTDKFAIDANTKSFESNWKNNPSYNKSLDSDIYANDSDQDGIKNPSDNCPYIYNPDQRDINADMKGDLCSDDDNDNLAGYLDNCIYINNPNQEDINNNNIGDACEFDKDKDGIFDSIDNCINTPNPDQKDEDGDNIGDACDNCNLYNPEQRISSGNSLGDICIDAAKSAEKQKQYEDKDKDGILDPVDNCRQIANKDQLDSDEDGVGNACDNCQNIKNYDQQDNDKNKIGDICEDIDKDGITGYVDNCSYTSNSDQKDDDNNGIGNLCEDQDEDQIINAIDNCPDIYNFDQRDIDNDKIGDACDSKDDRFIESNRPFFVGISLLFVCIFGRAIYMMINKLNNKEIN